LKYTELLFSNLEEVLLQKKIEVEVLKVHNLFTDNNTSI